jgi:pimeloyl-ACP methyl ester carboxylesterase
MGGAQNLLDRAGAPSRLRLLAKASALFVEWNDAPAQDRFDEPVPATEVVVGERVGALTDRTSSVRVTSSCVRPDVHLEPCGRSRHLASRLIPSMLPLVFLPGAGGRAAFWRPVAEQLADLGPAVRLAWPGFGDVPADPAIGSLEVLFAWLLRQLPLGPGHVVAQSMGGVLAARLAIEYPERVETLVLCATSGGVDVAGLGGADWRPDYRASLPDVPDWFVVDRTDLTAHLGEIRAPTLLLNGDADPICPPPVARLLEARIPGARSAVLRGGTHAFANERPAEVAGAIRAHIGRCRIARSP